MTHTLEVQMVAKVQKMRRIATKLHASAVRPYRIGTDVLDVDFERFITLAKEVETGLRLLQAKDHVKALQHQKMNAEFLSSLGAAQYDPRKGEE